MKVFFLFSVLQALEAGIRALRRWGSDSYARAIYQHAPLARLSLVCADAPSALGAPTPAAARERPRPPVPESLATPYPPSLRASTSP